MLWTVVGAAAAVLAIRKRWRLVCYRGEHHPADVLGSILFSSLWITTLFLLVRPNQQDGDRAPAAHSAPLSSPAARTAAGTGRTR